jgi:hypothetical protein
MIAIQHWSLCCRLLALCEAGLKEKEKCDPQMFVDKWEKVKQTMKSKPPAKVVEDACKEWWDWCAMNTPNKKAFFNKKKKERLAKCAASIAMLANVETMRVTLGDQKFV